MRQLWAPWRMAYIKSRKPTACFLCATASERNDRAHYILYRSQRCYIMLNRYPYTNGHLLVSPYLHRAGPEELDGPTLLDLMQTANRGLRALKAAYHPDGFNLGMNLGLIAGAGIADHLHLHIVPRWSGDTSFLAALAETRVLPETLEATYTRLRAHLRPVKKKRRA